MFFLRQKKLSLVILFLSLFSKSFCFEHTLKTNSVFDRICYLIARNSAVRSYQEHTYQDHINSSVYGSAIAPRNEYVQLGQEAQSFVGTSPDGILPVKKLSSVYSREFTAIAQPDAIYIDDDLLSDVPYGVSRCVLFHEAVHAKYSDHLLSKFFLVSSSIGSLTLSILSMIVVYKAVQRVNPFVFRGAGGVSELVAVTVGVLENQGVLNINGAYAQYTERRADIEGHYATRCHMCVQESANSKKVLFEELDSPFKNNGYLWADDLEKIAHDLEAEGLLCEYHRNLLAQGCEA